MRKWLAVAVAAILAVAAVTVLLAHHDDGPVEPRRLSGSLDINIGPTATPTATPGTDPAFPNVSAARVAIAANGSDSGANCRRFNPALSDAAIAAFSTSTLCATAAKAYSLMSNGDTAWVWDGNYGTSHAWDFEVNAPASFKTSVGTDCHATRQCFYFIPRPSHETGVLFTSASDDDGYSAPGFKVNKTPDNLYYANFTGPRGCASFSSPATGGATTGFAKDITVANITGTDCTYYMVGPWSYIRILGVDNSYNCSNPAIQSGGSVFPAGNDPNGADGQATNHIYVPHDVLVANSYFHDYILTGCGPAQPHMDCFHPRSGYNITFRGNTFNNCYDSSILWEGLQEAGFSENNVIENNWFGPTQCCGNNCCLRGAQSGQENTEVFDDYIIRFNTSVGVINNKPTNVMNNVQFIGNIAMGANTCAGGTWRYNKLGSSACDATDTGGVTNASIKLVDQTIGGLDLHIQAGSSAIGFVPSSQANGCAAVGGTGIDKAGVTRPASCAAGSLEP